jgi:hypothetical protein
MGNILKTKENKLKTNQIKRFDVNFERELYNQLVEYGNRKNASLAEVIRYALKELFDKELPKE